MQQSLRGGVPTAAGISLDGAAVDDAESTLVSPSRLRIIWYVARQSTPRALFASLALLSVLVAVVGPFVAPYPSTINNYISTLYSPSWQHFFGTDQVGRDVFSRVLTGAHLSLEVAAVVVVAGAMPVPALAFFRAIWVA